MSTLFDHMARQSDPDTSHKAAASMRGAPLSNQRARVLEVIEAARLYGATAYEIASRTGYQQSVVARRCTDLHDLRLIADTGRTRPGSSGRQLIVWEAA